MFDHHPPFGADSGYTGPYGARRTSEPDEGEMADQAAAWLARDRAKADLAIVTAAAIRRIKTGAPLNAKAIADDPNHPAYEQVVDGVAADLADESEI